jgi:ABC-2 type transport system permease protein
MIEDFKTVVWKEWREHILQYGSVVKWLLSMALLVGTVGIFLPLQFGRTAVDSVFLLTWIWMPLLVITNSVADAIAGERERHTLETLLASRLRDSAILLGKIAVPVLQSWAAMIVAAVLAVVTVNVAHGEGHLIMYPGSVLFGIMVIPLVAGLLIAGIGVFASTHAATVRQAYQRMIIPLFAIVLLPSLGISLLPRDMLASFYSPEFAENGLGGALVVMMLVIAGWTQSCSRWRSGGSSEHASSRAERRLPGRAGAHTQGTLIWQCPCRDSPFITR